jgi:hypothetical protein
MKQMTDEHVDGNAIGGLLMGLFGQEMTDARGCCASCGSVHHVGEMIVYQGMGDVMRCPTCGDVVMVSVTIRERIRVNLDALRWLELPPEG